MAISILQKPGDIQSAQSPIVFSVLESTQAYTSSEFQYTANLYIWSGTQSQSGSYLYQARKFPNPSGSGIFDFSKFINSTLTDLTATNDSNIKYYKAEFGFQYYTSSTNSYVTQSGGLTPVTCSTGGTMFKAYDGYNLFPNPINTTLYTSDPYWPFMTDMGSVTQSVQSTDVSNLGNGVRGVALWVGANDTSYPTLIAATCSYQNGSINQSAISLSNLTASTTTSLQTYQFGAAPGDASGIIPVTNSGSALTKYKLQAYSGSVVLSTLNYVIQNECYYTPVRVVYKNRFGQFDFFNFYKRHNDTFNTEQRLYQPQIGTWESSTLSYDQFQTSQQRYIVDATQVLECNTDFLQEGYNDLFKQLLVSDEIYWLYDEVNYLVKPLTIKTNSLQFKTGVNNKLIQYTIAFDIGQPYKLII